MFTIGENAVKKAVERIGGVTKTSNLLGVSNGCVHSCEEASCYEY